MSLAHPLSSFVSKLSKGVDPSEVKLELMLNPAHERRRIYFAGMGQDLEAYKAEIVFTLNSREVLRLEQVFSLHSSTRQNEGFLIPSINADFFSPNNATNLLVAQLYDTALGVNISHYLSPFESRVSADKVTARIHELQKSAGGSTIGLALAIYSEAL